HKSGGRHAGLDLPPALPARLRRIPRSTHDASVLIRDEDVYLVKRPRDGGNVGAGLGGDAGDRPPTFPALRSVPRSRVDGTVGADGENVELPLPATASRHMSTGRRATGEQSADAFRPGGAA